MKLPICLGVLCGLSLVGTMVAAAEPLIVAHRGASYDAPENTLAAFRLAWEQGADAIEGDFYLTSDGKIACIHDKTTKKVAPRELVVAKTTLAELRTLDVGSWKHPRFREERIPTLKEVIETVPDGKRIVIEIKCGLEIVPALKTTLAESSLKRDQILIISFQDEVIARCKKELPQYKALWLTSFKQDEQTKQWSPTHQEVLQTLEATNADGLDVKAVRPMLTREFVQKLRDRNLEFHTWTVNDLDDARWLHKLGVNSITTDRPAYLRKAFTNP